MEIIMKAHIVEILIIIVCAAAFALLAAWGVAPDVPLF